MITFPLSHVVLKCSKTFLIVSTNIFACLDCLKSKICPFKALKHPSNLVVVPSAWYDVLYLPEVVVLPTPLPVIPCGFVVLIVVSNIHEVLKLILGDVFQQWNLLLFWFLNIVIFLCNLWRTTILSFILKLFQLFATQNLTPITLYRNNHLFTGSVSIVSVIRPMWPT